MQNEGEGMAADDDDDSMKAHTEKESFNNWLLWSQTFSHSPLSPLRSFCCYDYCRRRRR